MAEILDALRSIKHWTWLRNKGSWVKHGASLFSWSLPKPRAPKIWKSKWMSKPNLQSSVMSLEMTRCQTAASFGIPNFSGFLDLDLTRWLDINLGALQNCSFSRARSISTAASMSAPESQNSWLARKGKCTARFVDLFEDSNVNVRSSWLRMALPCPPPQFYCEAKPNNVHNPWLCTYYYAVFAAPHTLKLFFRGFHSCTACQTKSICICRVQSPIVLLCLISSLSSRQ